MKWSQALIPTLREVPKDAEISSHQLLLRAGLIRQLAGGVYTFLPLGLRVLRKVEQIVREEMDAAGALEVLMPAMHPREVWEQTGRATSLNDILFKFKDRSDRQWLLGPTHEEIVTSLAAAEIRSYKQLPKNIYQIQTKFRDEPRPRFGLIRVKEFIMKDAYSFDVDQAGLDRSYQTMYEAYKRIFARLGLKTLDVEAHSGAMGGSHSYEFMVASPAGEDRIALCPKCNYAANLEKATSRVAVGLAGAAGVLEKFATPGVRTIEDLTKPPYNCAAQNQIKTLVYMLNDKLTLVLVRGCDSLNEAKLPAVTARPAHPEEIKAALGALPGSLGAVGVTKLPVLADETLRGRTGMVTGANEDDHHLRGVDVGRDITVAQWLDVRTVQDGEGCPKCDGALKIDSAIEVGHVFKLGTKYSTALGANYLDEKGESKVMIMGCYGIGVSRCVAAIVEQCHDDKGIVWPRGVAPFEVAVLPLNTGHAETMKVAGEIYRGLQASGISVILDDRTDRPGVKFNDADLVGFPVRVTVGEKSLVKGVVELKVRREAELRTVTPADAVGTIRDLLAQL
ncbi:MAG: Proline--tRNA ligase [Verrucomicrobiae bacterium]|nr:Proline--tRNA ligase [Verrucomicrobiae bacterium]